MTKTKKRSRFFAVALAIVLVMALAVPAFAASGDKCYTSVGNTAYQLNAATEYTPTVGTKITVWTNTGSFTQRWDATVPFPGTSLFYMVNASNKMVAITNNGGAQAILAAKNDNNATNQAMKETFEGGVGRNERYGLVLPGCLRALTVTSYYNGAQVQWQGSNGQNNQLWHNAMFS